MEVDSAPVSVKISPSVLFSIADQYSRTRKTGFGALLAANDEVISESFEIPAVESFTGFIREKFDYLRDMHPNLKLIGLYSILSSDKQLEDLKKSSLYKETVKKLDQVTVENITTSKWIKLVIDASKVAGTDEFYTLEVDEHPATLEIFPAKIDGIVSNFVRNRTQNCLVADEVSVLGSARQNTLGDSSSSRNFDTGKVSCKILYKSFFITFVKSINLSSFRIEFRTR